MFRPAKLSQRFLIQLLRFLDSIRGLKTIVYRASNNSKRMVENTLAQVFKRRPLDAPTIRVLGGCYCQCWTPDHHLISRDCMDFCWTQPNTLWLWLEGMTANQRLQRVTDAIEGSITPQLFFKHKGLMTIGCLMCHKSSECVHDKRSKPGRIEPNGDVGTASDSMW